MKPTMTIYGNRSSSNPSLITAGLPSNSIMTSRLIQPSSTTTMTKQNYYFNQNRATDTQPISLHSQSHTTLSHRTTSDIYLNLSRKDIDDLMTALHTLAQHVQNDMISNSLQKSDCRFDHYLNLVEASLKSLSSYILDQLIYIDQNEPESNIQMLPQQAHTLQILSVDLKPCHFDVATQWSLQNLIPTNSTTILTELSQSRTTIATNNSAVHTPLVSRTQSFMDTSSLKQNHICDDLSVTPLLNKKKIKRTTIKLAPKRPRYHPSKSSKNNPTTKRFRSYHHSPSNSRLMTLIQSLKTTDLQEDSSFDFFDTDTTFSDTIISEN